MRGRPARLFAAALVVALGSAAAGCKREAVTTRETSKATATTTAAAVTALDARHEPLRSRFEAAAGSPRLVVLASPT